MSEGVEWGVHCVTLLAALPPGTTLPAGRLAEFHGVPVAYLAKHLQALARAGVVAAETGARGGYRLARPPEDISVLDVVEAIEGSTPAFRCTEIRQRGPAALAPRTYRVPCAVHRVMASAEDAWRGALKATSIADVVGMVARNASPLGVVKAATWLQEVVR